jgi:hypothetical protein
VLLSLRVVARRLKESLSRQLLFDQNTTQLPQRTVTLVMRGGEIYRGVVKLDQDRFQVLTKDLATKFEGLIETGLGSIGLQDEDIGQVVLVGGGAQLFTIYHTLERRFAGKNLVLADNPDECVAVGCSLEYGAAASKSRPSLLFMPDFDLGSVEPPAAKDSEFILQSAEGQVFPLVSGDNRVGRTPANEIHLVGEKISRFHARLVVSEGSVEVFDLGSTNGTFVNETRLEPNQAVPLQPEDEIRFGDQRFHLKQSS